MPGKGKRQAPRELVEDEEPEQVYERVAGIDVAKASGVVCTRLPPVRDGGRRVSRSEGVPATIGAISELAARLLADGVQMVSMESASVIFSSNKISSNSRRSEPSRTRP
jgi:hypothetical protein